MAAEITDVIYAEDAMMMIADATMVVAGEP